MRCTARQSSAHIAHLGRRRRKADRPVQLRHCRKRGSPKLGLWKYGILWPGRKEGFSKADSQMRLWLGSESNYSALRGMASAWLASWDVEVTFAAVPREDFNRRWVDSRRAGGGGGDPIAKPLGVLMLMLATLAVVTRATRQSNLNASLLAGNIFGYFLLDERADTALSGEIQKTLTEFGMTFVLFFAGLSVQLPDRYLKRHRLSKSQQHVVGIFMRWRSLAR